MELLKLVKLSDPILHRRAQSVDPAMISQGWFQLELDQLVEAMRAYNGVGIAAPQVGINRQVFACEVRNNNRYPEAPRIELQVYINPKIVQLSSKEIILQEGCLSVPLLRGDVPRSANLVLEALDRNGKEVMVKAEGFLARIIQHECDHLNGHIFLERVRDYGSLVRWQSDNQARK